MAKEEKAKEASTKKTTPKKEAKTTKKETKVTPKKETKTTTSKAKETVKPVIKEETKPTVIQEEPHYGRTLMAAIIIFLIFVGGYIAVQWNKGGFKKDSDKENAYVATEDEKRFKKEYESLNGTIRVSNNQKNRDVKIMDDNNIKYITVAEAAEIIDSGSGVIYFGFAACPWCRNIVGPLLNAMDSTNLDTIYYVDVRPNDDASLDVRDKYELNNRNKPKKAKDGEPGYDDILLALASELSDYRLPIPNSNNYVETGKKRLGAPTVIAVKNGILTGFHAGTYEGHNKDENGVLADLTKEQEDELFKVYSDMFAKYLGTDCGEEGC